MAFKLSEEEIQERFVRLTNLERLHGAQKKRSRELAVQVKELTAQLQQRDELIEKLLLRVGDLEKMVFGRKKNNDDNLSSSSDQSSSGSNDPKKPKKKRTKDSYQRFVPTDAEVTKIEHHSVTVCKHCKGELSRFEEAVRYVEDIILPQLLKKATKTITKHIIERGYCARCGNWTAAQDLRGSIVSLGKNIKLLVTYLTTILDCSYEQVKTLSSDLYGIQISDGEIASILQETAKDWLPEYERLKEEIRSGPAIHLDETTWPIQIFGRHCYAWVMSAVASPIRIYKLAMSRGKDHATELLGDTWSGVRITDCFPGYMYMEGLHQICWAHLFRKIRDLLSNENLCSDKKPHVQEWHDEFKQLYSDLRSTLAQPFKINKRLTQEEAFRERIAALRQKSILDPKPLADLKKLLVQYDHALFTCLYFDNIPCDNNRAERDLRSLVIKRKKSFGSRTEAGARAMEILLSVTWSTWHVSKGNFLPVLSALSENHQKA